MGVEMKFGHVLYAVGTAMGAAVGVQWGAWAWATAAALAFFGVCADAICDAIRESAKR